MKERVASYLVIRSFVNLSTSFVHSLLFSQACGRPFGVPALILREYGEYKRVVICVRDAC